MTETTTKPDMSEATLLNEYRAKPAKFHEGWDMHRRGFPFRSLVSIEAKEGWVARERFFPVRGFPLMCAP